MVKERCSAEQLADMITQKINVTGVDRVRGLRNLIARRDRRFPVCERGLLSTKEARTLEL